MTQEQIKAMTPTEKRAKELARQFGGNAKYVCLEILEELKQIAKPEYTMFCIYEPGDKVRIADCYEKIEYWQTVKQEIEKL